MLFLLTAFALESDCKDTKFFLSDKIYFVFHRQCALLAATPARSRREADAVAARCRPLGDKKTVNGRPWCDDGAAKVPVDEGQKRHINLIRELLKLYSLLQRKVIVRSNQGAIKEQLKR